jgi:hypothetical protein
MNNVPISLTAGNVLTVNGEALLSNDSNTSISTTGNITADYFFGNGSQLTGLNTNKILNGTSNVEIATANGNVVITADGTNQWNFANDGILTVPLSVGSSSNQIKYGLGNLFVWNDGGWTIGEYNGELSGTEGIRINPDIEGPVDITLPATQLANTTPTSISNFLGNVVVNSGSNYVSYQWKFDHTGNLILPDTANASIKYANGDPYGSTGQWAFNGDTAYNSTNNGLYIQASQGNNDGGAYFPYTDEGSTTRLYNISGAGIEFGAGANTWILNPDASIQFPQINTPRGDNPSGSIYGYTLVIGDGENEAVITTPNGVEGIDDSQRLVINPGKGRDGTSGEGGDIYLWAGRGGSGDAPNAISGGSGGDIKIRGGQGGGGIDATGDGGYILIEAGDSSALGGSAGYIEISGGVSQDLTGGYVNISGGQGVTGADANLTGGVGTAGSGGAVRLTGGTSANGLPEYGNIYVQSGINTWVFDNTGNLIINHGSQITEVASPVPGNYALALSGTGVIDPDQQLLIYPTSLDANHLHLTSGNLYNTELFLGNDNLYVKLANTGDVVINTDDLVGNTAQWTFGTDGVLSAAGNISASNFVGSGSNVELVAGSSTWTFDNTGNLTVPGNMIINGNVNVFGSDTALIQPTDNVPLALISSGSNAGTTTFWVENINDPANSAIAGMYAPLQGTANVRIITGNNATTVNFWDFDNTGNLTAPGNVVANTFVSNAFNVVTAGSLFISSQYGLGTVGTILEQDGLLELVANGTGGCVLVGWDSTYGNGIGNVAQIYFNRVGGGEGNAILTTGNAAGTSYEWNFDNTGNLTIPGTMIVAGGIVGSGASPAPTLSGFDSLSAISITATGTGTVINAASGNITTNEVTGTRFNFLNGSYTATLTGSGATANYSLNLPANAGSNGQVLTTDGSGNLSWTTAAGGSYGNANVADFLAAFGSNVVSTTGNVLASYFIATDSGNVLSLTTRSGDSNNSNANPQIIMGYAGTADYPSFIHTTHNAGTPVDNTIEFWTSDGTQAGTFPANAVLGLTVTNGNIETGGILTNNYYYANGTPVSFGGSSYGNANVADFLDSLGSNAIITTGNITGGNVSATANVIGNGYARFSGTFDESQASTAGLYLGYAGGTPRMMFGTGNTSQTLEIDNDGGTLRFYKPGTTLASLTNTGDFSVTGNISGNTGGFAIGYRDIPQVTFSANATAALTDAGKHFYSTTSGNLALTLPDNSNVAYPTGATLTVVVNAAGNVLVNQGVGVTLYQAGSSTTGNRVVGAYGMATVMKVATNTWVINGTGVY